MNRFILFFFGLVLCLGVVAGCDGSATGPDSLCVDDQCDDSNECTLDSCDPQKGCVYEPVDVSSECDDSNPCTLDSCDSEVGCVHDGTGVVGECDDHNACTVSDSCQGDKAGTCVGQELGDGTCDDSNPCTLDWCEPQTGCVHDGTGVDVACDDGDACTSGDVCQADENGTCMGEQLGPEYCDDQDPCTIDICDPQAGCLHEIDEGGSCDDGDPCTGPDTCQADGSCEGLEPTSCDDHNPCTQDSCDPDRGCVHDGTGITDVCDDHNVCTDNDTCRGDSAGTCAGDFRPLSECDDHNPCTVDTCHPAQGCVHDGSGISSACDDGNPCTSGDVCQGDEEGTCIGLSTTNCDDSNPCTNDSCDPAVGCVNDGTGVVSSCDDGSVCTEDDMCQGDVAGTCAGTDITEQLCDDGNDCTTDTCHPVNGCRNELQALHECFPTFDIDYPPRGATIQGSYSEPTVMVTGKVTSGAGDITSFTINSVQVPLNPDGSFSQPIQVHVGGNVLVFEATDSYGSSRKRVQSFLWSTQYKKPVINVAGSGMADQGMGIWLGQSILDDGDHSLPPDDFATIFEMVLGNMDLGSLIDPNTPIAQQGGYDIYLTSLSYDSVSTSLVSIDGGMHVVASLNSISGDLVFDCPCGFPCTCWWTGGDSTGGLSMDSLVVNADILLSVNPDHTLHVTVANSSSTINNLDIWSNDWWTDFLISIVMTFIQDQLVASLEDEINSQLTDQLAPMLEDALGALAISQTFDLPKLDNSGDVITVLLTSDFDFTDFHTGGGAIGLRTAGYTIRQTPYDNLGVALRVMCGPSGQHLVIPGAYPFELVLSDDMLNELFYAAWNGGLLEFPIPPEMLGDLSSLEQYGITNLQLDLSGMLAPTACDCGDGSFTIFIGDLKLHASMDFAGNPLDIIVWASATMGMELTLSNGEIGVSITQIDGLETELDVVQDEFIGFVDLMGDGFEQLMRDALMQAFANGQLAAIPLPEIDLSSAVGLPPGSAVIALDPQDLSRQDGNTIIGGDLQ